MVYDFTESSPQLHTGHGEPGFAVYPSLTHRGEFVIFTDDGRGHGEPICTVHNSHWALRIAHCLDQCDASQFDAKGNIIR